jgi:hypothetical protein
MTILPFNMNIQPMNNGLKNISLAFLWMNSVHKISGLPTPTLGGDNFTVMKIWLIFKNKVTKK